MDTDLLHLDIEILETETVFLDSIDYQKVISQHSQENRSEKKLAVSINRDIDQEQFSQKWRLLNSNQDDTYSWRISIYSPNAIFIRPHFSNFSDQGEVYFYSKQGTDSVIGPYSRPASYGGNQFWGPVVTGEYLIIEVRHHSAEQPPPILVDKISHGYIDPISGEISDFTSENCEDGSCKEDSCYTEVSCESAWDNEETAVAKIYFEEDGSGYVCTGALIMDTDASYRNWFLTANHCISDSQTASTVIAYFNYKTSTCNGSVPNINDADQVAGADYVTGGSLSDFTLLELAEEPPAGTWYLGWSTSDLTSGQDVIGIHHPGGSHQRISYGDQSNDTYSYSTTYHWGVLWNTGSTEGGSSGSPLISADTRRLVGQLHGGDAACSYMSGTDAYGKFGESWNAGLSDYLAQGQSDERLMHILTEPEVTFVSQSGGVIGPFSGKTINTTGQEVSFQIYGYIKYPDGSYEHVLTSQLITLGAGESDEHNSAYLRIPSGLGAGEYNHQVDLYMYDGTSLIYKSTDSFPVYVSNSGARSLDSAQKESVNVSLEHIMDKEGAAVYGEGPIKLIVTRPTNN